jgi:hypothetical protein
MVLPPQKLYPNGFAGAPHVFGVAVGRAVGCAVGAAVGRAVGAAVGVAVGAVTLAVAIGTIDAVLDPPQPTTTKTVAAPMTSSRFMSAPFGCDPRARRWKAATVTPCGVSDARDGAGRPFDRGRRA